MYGKANISELKAYSSPPSRWGEEQVWEIYYKNRMQKWPLKGGRAGNKLASRSLRQNELSEIDGRDVYILQDARKLTNTKGVTAIEGGVEFLAYDCTYGRDPSGYDERMCARK